MLSVSSETEKVAFWKDRLIKKKKIKKERNILQETTLLLFFWETVQIPEMIRVLLRFYCHEFKIMLPTTVKATSYCELFKLLSSTLSVSVYYIWEKFILKWSRLILLVFYFLSLKYKPFIDTESRNNLNKTLQVICLTPCSNYSRT